MARKMNKGVLDQSKPEFSLEARKSKLRLSYFVHLLRRTGSLLKTNHGGEGGRQQEKRKAEYEMDQLPQRNHKLKIAKAEQGQL